MRTLFLVLLLMLMVVPAQAHLGSKDVYETATAGPYKLFITIRPPNVIPGVATVEARVTEGGAAAIHITPIPLTGEASKHPPASDAMVRSAQDPAYFTGAVWMMASGSWKVRFEIDGAGGAQTASVPVPAIALSTLKMQKGMGLGLAALGLFLVFSMAGLVAAAVREARLRPGVAPAPAMKRLGSMAMIGSLMLMLGLVALGGWWWNVEAAGYADNVYRPLIAHASLSGDTFDLRIDSFKPKAIYRARSNNDFLPDHGKLIHLYAIREPEMDAVFHLHPTLVAAGDFRMNLPTMPAGTYTLYGDVVHASGFPETLVTKLEVPVGLAGAALGQDDAEALPPGISAGPLGTSFRLPDGYAMVWDKPASLTANTAYAFHFRLVGPDGKPAQAMQPYLGMAGHAAFVKTDGTVFAHTHPEGSAAMAALDLANGDARMNGMAGMTMDEPVKPEVDFPYGFPSAGRYRLFIQMKHGGIVETGVFDASVQ